MRPYPPPYPAQYRAEVRFSPHPTPPHRGGRE